METATVNKPNDDQGNRVRIHGRVRGTFPNRGFFWITGDDEEKYFAHTVQVRNGWLIQDMWEGQGCTFVPDHEDRRGPRAMHIEMEDPNA